MFTNERICRNGWVGIQTKDARMPTKPFKYKHKTN